MEQSQTISRLINKIYQAAIDAAKLRDVLADICELVDADLGTVGFGDLKTGKVNYMLMAPEVIETRPGEDWTRYFTPWIQRVLKKDPERLYINEDLVGADQASSVTGAQEGFDFQHGFSGYFLLKKGGYGYVGFCCDSAWPGFDQEQLEMLELLLPHIKQAFEINSYLDNLTVLHDVTQERYEQYSIGILLFNKDGQIVFSNPIAKRLINEPGGIGSTEGRLYTESSAETAKLNTLIKRSIQTADIKGVINNGFLSISRKQLDKPPLSVSVTSYVNKLDARTVSASQGRALAVIFDPERRHITQEYVLESLYNLTSTEASLATGLAEGKTINELANDNGMSRETLRSQLKRVFQKTHTSRQSDLVRLVLTGPGALVI